MNYEFQFTYQVEQDFHKISSSDRLNAMKERSLLGPGAIRAYTFTQSDGRLMSSSSATQASGGVVHLGAPTFSNKSLDRSWYHDMTKIVTSILDHLSAMKVRSPQAFQKNAPAFARPQEPFS